MLSGIGPSGHLRQHNIPVVHDIKGVGENLADHNRVPILYETTPGYSLNSIQSSIPSALYHLYRGVFHRDGLLTLPIIEAASYFRIPVSMTSSNSSSQVDTYLIGKHISIRMDLITPVPKHLLTLKYLRRRT
jgi:choline dehydrogenase-like flavoprotein